MPQPRQKRLAISAVHGYEDGTYSYKPGAQVGQGATGYVFAGHRYPLSREIEQQGVPVALKYQAYDEATAAEVRERAAREKSMTDALTGCDGIVPVWSVFDDTVHSMVITAMPLHEGRTLADEISKGMPLDQAVSYITQIGTALDSMHSHGIVYHDLKAANVLVDGGKAYLTDFGAATRIGALQDARRGIVGSVHSVAPERFREPSAQRSSDIYSLGILAYRLLTGHVPFDDPNLGEIMRQHIEEAVPRFDHFTQGPIPADIRAAEDCVRHALAKDPVDRYASAGAFVQAFVTVVAEQRHRTHVAECHMTDGIHSVWRATPEEQAQTVRYFERASVEDKENVTACYLFACSLAGAGRVEDAEKVFRDISCLAPRNEDEVKFKKQATSRLQESARRKQGLGAKVLRLVGLREA